MSVGGMDGGAPRVALTIEPSRISRGDVLRVGTVGLRSRRTRTLLTGLGIAIGIATMVAVLGVSEASRAGLLAQLDRLGTNLLSVRPGQQILGGAATLPIEAPAMIRRIGAVQATAATTPVKANVYRNDRIPKVQTGGIAVMAAEPELLDALRGGLTAGVFLNDANAHYPAVVLGAQTARQLGISHLVPPVPVLLGGQRFTVLGILAPVTLAPELDRAALIGFPVAESMFGIDGSAGTIYVRVDPNNVNDVTSVLAGTANPEHPNEVEVSRPSDALAARAAATGAFTTLFLGLAAVALLVAGVGIANVMLMSVLERRSEIGLRRALGATRTLVAVQFVSEALVLSAGGGAFGVVAGSLAAAGFAASQGWTVVVPPVAIVGGLLAAIVIGGAAGLYPAVRAARVSPSEALRTA